jgi:CubicO group peptidase (beta-lactamase class C family)/D-alanyl-D-alanine dipeptidase
MNAALGQRGFRGSGSVTKRVRPAAQTRNNPWRALARLGIMILMPWDALVRGACGDDIVVAREPYAEATQILERWIGKEVALKGLPALSIALVDDQQIVWARGFGWADILRKAPATAETAYRVGSVSKLFTDLAVMQLVEAGRLDLDAPVEKLLPEFRPGNPFQVPITPRQLMSHRSGLVREPPVGHYFDPDPPPLAQVIRSLASTTLVFEPGKRTKYSNAGIAVVGAVVERVRGEPFAQAIAHALLEPLGMSRSSFAPGPALADATARGMMWSYDGRAVPTPTFLLGTGPAGNLVSTVTDLGRFLSFLFADGRSAGGGVIVKPATLRLMIEPQFAKPGESPGFGLGFSLSELDNKRCIGHRGAVYGFATELAALTDAKLGSVVITTADCANGFARHVGQTALRFMLDARSGRPLPSLEATGPIPRAHARQLAGRYARGNMVIDLVERNGKVFLSPFGDGMTVELRALGGDLVVDDRLARGSRLKVEKDRIALDGEWYDRKPAEKPPPCPARWAGMIGEYGWDHDVLFILEKDGRLHALIEWFFDYPLEEEGTDRFRFPESGLYSRESLVFARGAGVRAPQVEAAGVFFRRRKLDGEDGKTFQIRPRRPLDEVRALAERARPPFEAGEFLKLDLVELVKLDPSIRLDIRYASTNNFLGVPFYTSARAFLQRPAAEALVRAHRALGKAGYGLLIHDAYRPWQVSKMFWEATPDAGRAFVADPAQGSKHNRGAAVDLTLYQRATGEPVKMVGGYDEFSPQSFPDYPGGTALERWQRDLLRRAMEIEGFTVNEVEWWHFDHRDWARYPILNERFEELAESSSAN